MASIAERVRPALISVTLLTIVAALPWRERDACAPSKVATIVTIPKAIESYPFVMTPPVHPDARPWPYGMVITPLPTHDAIVQSPGSPFAAVLAALLAWLPRGAYET